MEYPYSVRPKTCSGQLNTVALSQLMAMCGISGRNWIDQFACGFFNTVTLAQKHTFELTDHERDVLSRAELPRSAARRFRGRASRSGCKNGPALWGEAMAQHAQCWLSGPIPLIADVRPATRRPNSYNIDSRFGVEQAEKLRACDDLRPSLTNLARQATTPIQLVSWDRISQIAQLLYNGVGNWGILNRTKKPIISIPTGPSRPGYIGRIFTKPS